MFANLTYEDQEAFFSLLDEYFESRPHLLSASSPLASPSSSRAPAVSTSARTLPPLASTRSYDAHRSSHESLPSPPSPAPKGPDTRTADEKREDMVMKFAMRSIKGSANTAGRGLSMVSRNTKAMSALDKYGAGGILRGAEGVMNAGKNKKPDEVHVQETVVVAEKKAPPPAPAKKSGIAGLGKSSFGGMFSHSKQDAPAAEVDMAPPISTSNTNLAPPQRTASQPQAEETAEGQAQALYDYAGGDSGDLSVQSGQIVNVLEKTSADWWTCEDGNGSRGLVPAAYLKET